MHPHGIAFGLWEPCSACADAARWNVQGLALTVAVTLSPLQFNAHETRQTWVHRRRPPDQRAWRSINISISSSAKGLVR